MSNEQEIKCVDSASGCIAKDSCRLEKRCLKEWAERPARNDDLINNNTCSCCGKRHTLTKKVVMWLCHECREGDETHALELNDPELETLKEIIRHIGSVMDLSDDQASADSLYDKVMRLWDKSQKPVEVKS